MRRIDLQEYQLSNPIALSSAELSVLLREAKTLDLTISPADGDQGGYDMRPRSTVGALELDGLSVLIRPKIGIRQLLSLACYAIGKLKFREEDFDFTDESALPDALAMALASHARRAFSRGLLHGYITVEESLHTVRGRIRFDEQMRRRFGMLLPVEVRYDEFTDDILANRLVKAAAYRLRGMRLRWPKARAGLGWIAAMLENVSFVEFPPNDVPEVEIGRLNRHYAGVVVLSRLILRHSAFEAERGGVRASGFLMDMNVVFQEFVTVALREALGVSERVFGESSISSLDVGGNVRLRPDLVWRESSAPVFVGDAKYKRVRIQSIPNADLYQLHAYVTALDLPGGMLVYAKDEGVSKSPTHTVRHTGKRLEVAALDLEQPLDDVIADVGRLAGRVRALRDGARMREFSAPYQPYP